MLCKTCGGNIGICACSKPLCTSCGSALTERISSTLTTTGLHSRLYEGHAKYIKCPNIRSHVTYRAYLLWDSGQRYRYGFVDDGHCAWVLMKEDDFAW